MSDTTVREESGEIRDRDQADSTRAVAPLRRATGALEIDTTGLPFDAQVSRIVEAATALTEEYGQE